MPELLEGLFRESAGKIVSTLTRILGSRHLELAEECVQDALVKALEKWPFQGIPEHPQAWLLQTAKNRAIDLLRRDHRAAASTTIPNLEDLAGPPAANIAIDDELGMVFLCCHPALAREAQVALVLKTVGGMGVKEIARAYLAQDSAIAQRLVRAKRQIREQAIEFGLPQALAEAGSRLDAVLEALYLLFNEGYSLREPQFSEEAIRLCGLLVSSASTALPKCHALLALMLLQSARDAARIDSGGGLNLLEQQDRSLWNRRRIGEGMRHLDLAANGDELTRYHLEAGIASLHATAPSWEATDWRTIEGMYEQLECLLPSPVVRLNRAIAAAQVSGPQRGLDLLNEGEGFGKLHEYAPHYAATGYFYEQLGRIDEAEKQYLQAIRCSPSEAERSHLRVRMAHLIRRNSEGFTTVH